MRRLDGHLTAMVQLRQELKDIRANMIVKTSSTDFAIFGACVSGLVSCFVIFGFIIMWVTN